MLKIVSSITSNGGIGRKGGYIIESKEYRTWLRENIQGCVSVVGRKTWDSGLLDIRNNELYVMTRRGIKDKTVKTLRDKKDVLDLSKEKEVAILGGGQIYKEFIDYADELYLAEMHGIYKADRHFPEFNLDDFDVTFMKDVEGKVSGVFKVYKRKK